MEIKAIQVSGNQFVSDQNIVILNNLASLGSSTVSITTTPTSMPPSGPNSNILPVLFMAALVILVALAMGKKVKIWGKKGGSEWGIEIGRLIVRLRALFRLGPRAGCRTQ